MRKNRFALAAGTVAALAVAGSASAQLFNSVYSSSATDIAPPSDIINTNNVRIIAGVDTDNDGNEEIIYMRVDGAAVGSTDTVSFRIFEADGTDNTYALKFSEDIEFADTRIGNFNQYNDIAIGDTDGADGEEIILYIGGPFGTGPITENLFVYASTADDAWGSGGTASQTLLAGSDAIDDIMGIEIGDVDGDGTPEITLSDDGTDNFTIVSVASGTFSAGTAALTTEVTQDAALQAGGSLYNHSIADLNNDGQPEVIGTHFNNNGYSVIAGTAADTYALVFDDSPGANANDGLFSPGNVDDYDIDGDGANAVFGLSSSHGGVYVLTGLTGVGGDLSTLSPSVEMFDGPAVGLTFQGTSTNGEQVPGQALRVTDFNNDGNEELMIVAIPDFANTSGGEVFFLEYNGTGADNDLANYTVIDSTTTGITSPEGFYGGDGGTPAGGFLDMDGDGLAEIVTGSFAAVEPGVQVWELAPVSSVTNWSAYQY